jgi:hexokinase
MYLIKLVNESAVREEIESNEKFITAEFKNTFSFDTIYDKISENLEHFVDESDVLKTYENVKDYSTNYTLGYLINTSKEIADRG